MTFYCAICRSITTAAIIMPKPSDYAGQGVCPRCVGKYFDSAIAQARAGMRDLYSEPHHSIKVTTDAS